MVHLFIELPLCLCNQRYLLNIRKNDDFESFNYCYTVWYHEMQGRNLADPSRDIRTQLTNPATYSKPEATKPLVEFSMPMRFHDIHQFEIMNDVQVDVFQFSKGDLLPMYVSNNKNIEPTMDILLLFNEDVHHYVLINNLIKLVCLVKEKQFTNNWRLCRNCFAVSHSEEQHRVHDDACRNHAPATIKIPAMIKILSCSKISRRDGLLHSLFTSTLSRF